MECGYEALRERIGRRVGAEEPDHRHRLLLPPRNDRPHHRRAAEQRDEKELHVIRSPRRRGRAARADASRPKILAVCGVDDKLEFGRLHDRAGRRLGTLGDRTASYVRPDAPHPSGWRHELHQPACIGKVAYRKPAGLTSWHRQVGKLHPPIAGAVLATKRTWGSRRRWRRSHRSRGWCWLGRLEFSTRWREPPTAPLERGLGIGIGRIKERGHTNRTGHQLRRGVPAALPRTQH